MPVRRTDDKEEGKIQVQYRRGQLLKTPRVRRLPVWLYPSLIENEYVRELAAYVNEIGKIVDAQINPHIQSLITERNADVPEAARTDDWATNAETLIDSAKISFDKIPFDPSLSAKNIGSKTDVWNDKQWQKMLNASLGVDVYQSEPWMNSTMSSFVKENTALITKMKNDTVDDISTTLQRSIREGQSSASIAKKLNERVNVGKNRARLIARDQVGKLNGQLTELRQTNIGVKRYKWITSGDERVRKSHKSNNGKHFYWNNAPGTGHPGSAIQCRCYAEPDMTPVFEEHNIKTRPTEVTIPKDYRALSRREQLIQQLSEQPQSTMTQAVQGILAASRHNVHAITIQKRVAGAVGYNLSKQGMYVKNLAKTVSNRGVRSRLLKRTIGRAKSSGVRMRLRAAPHLNSFYKKAGFRRVGNMFTASVQELSGILRTVNKLIPRIKPKTMRFHSITPKKLPKKLPVGKPSVTKKKTGVTATPLKKDVNRIVGQQEKGIQHEKDKEYGILMSSKDGKIVKSYEGKESSLDIPDSDIPLMRNNILTHNHWNNTSLSGPDMEEAFKSNLLQLRATSPKYTHIMQRKKGAKDWFEGIPEKDNWYLGESGKKLMYPKKLPREWLSEVQKNHTKINNKWLLKNKGKFPDDNITAGWFEEATHMTMVDYSKKFGFNYKRVNLVKVEKIRKKAEALRIKNIDDLRKEAITFRDKLKDVEPQALRTLFGYTSEYDFENINGVLSGRTPKDFLSPNKIRDVRSDIKNMDKIFEMDYPKFKGDTYRGIDIHSIGDFERIEYDWKKGATVQPREFLSASRSRGQAMEFLKRPIPGIPQVLINIKSKSGLFVDDVLSKIPKEQEVLFNRDTELKILHTEYSMKKGQNIYEIEAEEI